MKLFDDVGESLLRVWTKLEKKCPVCGADLDIVPELMSNRFPTIECDRCHLQIEVSTRNNYRIAMVFFTVMPLTFALGLLFSMLFLGG